MGLGKTIEMLSLIHTHKSQLAPMSSSSAVNLPKFQKSKNEVEFAPCTTLVVAPMSLLAQWQSEAEKASAPGTLKTLLYYGNDKNVNLQMHCTGANAGSAPNLVITSYGTVGVSECIPLKTTLIIRNRYYRSLTLLRLEAGIVVIVGAYSP